MNLRRFLRKYLKINFWIFGILLVGAVLRLLFLADVPSGLHRDEAQSGYNAYLISRYLKNIHGEFLPTDIDYYGDYRPPVNSYLTAFFVKLLGLNEWSIRLPSVLAGIATIYLVYILSLNLYKARKPAKLSALFLAISPLHIVFSRSSADGVIDIFFTLSALVCLDLFLRKGSGIWLAAGYMLWLLGYFSYPTSRILLPIFTVLYLFSFRLSHKLPRNRTFAVIAVLAFYFIFPWYYLFSSGKTTGRFNQVSIFSFPEVKRQLQQEITESGTLGVNPIIVRVFHNKPISYFRDIAFRHLSFFSPSVVLFDTTRPSRFRVPDLGMITWWEYLGLFIAAYYLIKRKSKIKKWFPILALAVAPLPSSLTFDDYPNFQRAIYMAPFIQITAGWGWWQVLNFLKKKARKRLAFALTALFIYQTAFFSYQYFLIAPIHEPFYRDYEQKELALYLNSALDRYQRIGLSSWNDSYIFYLLFNKINIFDLKVRKQSKYFSGNFTLGSLNFYQEKCIPVENLLKDELELVIQMEECPKYEFYKPVRNIFRKDGSLSLTAYEIDRAFLPMEGDNIK